MSRSLTSRLFACDAAPTTGNCRGWLCVCEYDWIHAIRNHCNLCMVSMSCRYVWQLSSLPSCALFCDCVLCIVALGCIVLMLCNVYLCVMDNFHRVCVQDIINPSLAFSTLLIRACSVQLVPQLDGRVSLSCHVPVHACIWSFVIPVFVVVPFLFMGETNRHILGSGRSVLRQLSAGSVRAAKSLASLSHFVL